MNRLVPPPPPVGRFVRFETRARFGKMLVSSSVFFVRAGARPRRPVLATRYLPVVARQRVRAGCAGSKTSPARATGRRWGPWPLSGRPRTGGGIGSRRRELHLEQGNRDRRQLLRVLADLAVEARIVVRVEPALEDHGVMRTIMEAGSDAQGAESIPRLERVANLLRFGFHMAALPGTSGRFEPPDRSQQQSWRVTKQPSTSGGILLCPLLPEKRT